MALKVKDLRLLSKLDENARRSYSKIGKKIRMSQQLISHKIKGYLDDGRILNFATLIDYSKLGYLNFRVYFKINYISEEKFNQLIEKISQVDDIVEVFGCQGKYDLIATFASPNPSQFNKMLKELIDKNETQLKYYDILTTVVTHCFSRDYLYSGKEKLKLRGDIIIGGDRPLYTLNDKEREILSLILGDSRKSSVEIANKIKLDPKTVTSKIKKMKKDKIILGYKPTLNLQQDGYYVNKILLKYHNLSIEKEEELQQFCRANYNIVELIKLFGEWDLELTVETKTQEEFRRIYIKIRQKFEDIIQEFDNFPVLKTYKKIFLPEEIVKVK